MTNLFRKLLIRIGKVIPFLMAAVLLVNYIEIIYAVTNGVVYADLDGYIVYDTPISIAITDVIYIDYFDVLMVWVLCFALELCKYAFRCARLITLNLAFRTSVERIELPDGTITGLAFFMALYASYCVYGVSKTLPRQENRF